MAAEVIFLLKEQHVYVTFSIWVIEFSDIKWQKDFNYLLVEGIARYVVLEKKSKSQQDLLLHLFLYVLECDSVLVRTGTMPTFNSGELLQRSEQLLIFIKVSQGWILTVIYILASASLFLSE